MTLTNLFFAVLIGVVVLWLSLRVIRMLSTPPPEIDPEDVVLVDQDYRCSVCGAELTMKAVNVREGTAPRHCREEMDAVWRPPT